MLAPHGSIAVELGDTYSGNVTDPRGGGLRASANLRGDRNSGSQPTSRRIDRNWPLVKSLALIPELYRIGLAYGINPLTGAESPAGRWRVRNVVRWHRPNPPVGALGDKYRPATTDMVIATRAKDRWFDLDAVRDRSKKPNTTPRAGAKEIANQDRRTNTQGTGDSPAGAPPLDTWVIPTAPYRGSHYAAFPPKLCEIPIKSMCPLEVCTQCGTPRRRITESSYKHPSWASGGTRNGLSRQPDRVDQHYSAETLGWTVCDCPTPTHRPGVVLDPFGGTGTVGAVGTGLGRNVLLIDVDERNLELAFERVGGLLMTSGTVGDPLPGWLNRGGAQQDA